MEKYPNVIFISRIIFIFIILLFLDISTGISKLDSLNRYDSIESINFRMKFHLSFAKMGLNLEKISFNYYKYNNFGHLYDSLSNIYIPFREDFYYSESLNCYFLIDPCRIYILSLYLPEDKFHNKYRGKYIPKNQLFSEK